MSEFTFKRLERLKSRKLIEALFKDGQSFGAYPLRLVWREIQPPVSSYPIQFTVSVSKKKFKKAVQRNRIKRQVREAWRLNKPRLYKALQPSGKQFAFMVLYTANELFEYQEIEKSMQKIIRKFLYERQKNDAPTNF